MNQIELPRLEDYEVSPKTGFLPSELPLTRLTDPYYAPWEDIVAVLPSLILTKRIRKFVDMLPLLTIDRIRDDKRELRRAYSILSFMTHAYVWNVDVACENLPTSLAGPLLQVAEILEVPPLATYSSLILWNFKPIMPMDDEEEWDLDNLTTINTYTGSIDESWFYLVSVYFEYKGARSISKGLEAMKYVREDNMAKVTETLKYLAESIDMLGSVLMRMEEMCDPHCFYYRIRPYLAGWRNMAQAGLPHGLKYGDEDKFRSYAGGSNAQSSLIQTLDIMLGVEHYATGEKQKRDRGGKAVSSSAGANGFMNEMKSYMPGPHRRFLEHLSLVSNIRDYVVSKNNSELTLAYDACVAMLKAFRDKHIQIVTRYIILQAKKKPASTNTLRSGLSKTAEKKEQKGTGGTALIPFLKQCRDETGDTAAGEWGQKVLSSCVLRFKDDTESSSKRQKLGLAGDWVDAPEEKPAGHW